MAAKPTRILAINPGSKYLGLAVFEGMDLRFWTIKVLKGKWSPEKIKKARAILYDLIDRYGVNTVALKNLHRSRNSRNLNQMVNKIKDLLRRRGLETYQYSIKEIEEHFSSGLRINKRQMAEMVVSVYPFLRSEFERERKSKNPYFIRMFEAIALGVRCLNQLDR